MTLRPIVICAALALLAACDRGPEAPKSGAASPAGSPAQAGGASSGGSTTPTTPANISPPASQEDKREGRNPQQGQVDPKQSEQQKDFQQRGDEKGPSNPSAQPR